jgi:hypothetical protein
VLPPDARPPEMPAAPCNPAPAPSTCVAGQWCSKATRTCLTAGTVMRWNFNNMCAGSGDIEVRLQDVTHGGGWPAADKVYIVPQDAKRFIDISCIEGSKVCYGARARGAALFWGADTDFSEDCTSCCHMCTTGSTPVHDLVCN